MHPQTFRKQIFKQQINLELMKKNSLQFKTNINCSGCVTTIKPHLDKIIGAENWQVDTADKDKVLTILANVNPEVIIESVKNAGFKIEAL
jgi:copper chaperone